MYRHLWANAPKECLEYADYSFDQHFKKSIPSFLPRETIRHYIVGRAIKSNVRQYIRFNCVVFLMYKGIGKLGRELAN